MVADAWLAPSIVCFSAILAVVFFCSIIPVAAVDTGVGTSVGAVEVSFVTATGVTASGMTAAPATAAPATAAIGTTAAAGTTASGTAATAGTTAAAGTAAAAADAQPAFAAFAPGVRPAPADVARFASGVARFAAGAGHSGAADPHPTNAFQPCRYPPADATGGRLLPAPSPLPEWQLRRAIMLW